MKKISLLMLLLVAIIVMVLILRPDNTLKKEKVKREYAQPDSKFLNWNGTEIHYTVDGTGFPVLMIHGFGSSNWDFYLLDSLLCDKYRIIRIDMPGFGLSDYPQNKKACQDIFSTYNNYFDFLLDTLHLDSFYVMGNSLGGMFAWNLSIRHPQQVKKLVLLNSAGYEMDKVIKEANADAFRKGYVRWFLQKGIPKFLIRDGMNRICYNRPEIYSFQTERMWKYWNREGNLQNIMRMVNYDHYIPSAEIKQIQCPTLILWGKQDQIVSVRYADSFHHDIKNSQLIIYDSCGHVPMIERPLDVERDVLRFFKE